MLRVVRITDSTPIEGAGVYEVKFLGMGNFSVLAECILPEEKAEVEIDLDEFTLSFMGQDIDLDYIKDTAREFAEEIVRVETARNYPEAVKKEFKRVLRANGILLRTGWGTGWYSSTIGTLLKTHPEFERLRKKIGLGRKPGTDKYSRNFPKIGRFTFDQKPLGWISIS